MGNPSSYHTFADEGYNGEIAKIANVAHPRTFTKTVFRRTLAVVADENMLSAAA